LYYGGFVVASVEEKTVMATVLITGTSSGIGLETALELARRGHRVLATMRNPGGSPALAEAAAGEGLPIEIRMLDVDSDESVAACFAGISEPLDVLVNNAGVERHGAIEELSMADIVGTMNTNYFGAVRCMKEVLPAMREARSGCIINVSSVSGHVSNSPLGAYSASKFALEAISEAVAGEMKPFNVRVAIVKPGIQDTKMAQTIGDARESIYPQGARMAAMFRAALANPTPPSVTAGIIGDIIDSGTWALRHPAGPDAAALLAWRASKSDEEWVEWSAQEDDAWYAQVEREFGFSVR
jgi:NAD(P)-dependent dehydrogenase (short-subunit alcohol dehydrogenase family)